MDGRKSGSGSGSGYVATAANGGDGCDKLAMQLAGAVSGYWLSEELVGWKYANVHVNNVGWQ